MSKYDKIKRVYASIVTWVAIAICVYGIFTLSLRTILMGVAFYFIVGLFGVQAIRDIEEFRRNS